LVKRWCAFSAHIERALRLRAASHGWSLEEEAEQILEQAVQPRATEIGIGNPPGRTPLNGVRISNVIGFDDAPFSQDHRGDVSVVGTVYTGLRLDGVLIGRVRRDGANAARKIVELMEGSKFFHHAQLIMLQGIAFGGFNVVDVPFVYERLGLPVLVVARRAPDIQAIKRALLRRVPGGARKWRLIERLGPMEPLAQAFVQRAGLSTEAARHVMERFTLQGHMPEPLRTAHLIAGAIRTGQSRGRV
jgi:endonuclease V-like protein UPF0215 family